MSALAAIQERLATLRALEQKRTAHVRISDAAWEGLSREERQAHIREGQQLTEQIHDARIACVETVALYLEMGRLVERGA